LVSDLMYFCPSSNLTASVGTVRSATMGGDTKSGLARDL
jgi:hypothetical protein